ncbi:MAG TPA: TIGR03067 domain-containing protein [Isosphaeraceae bacterium]|jgi:uncharacterized protein (TIGR03067 family)|nr:TIGR03067 domain-containing protein [Isosphaeraceae bacterium]
MFRSRLAVFLASLSATMLATHAQEGGADLDKMQGTWVGRALEGQLSVTMTIEGRNVTTVSSGRGGKATSYAVVTLDESTNPKSFKLVATGDPKLDLEKGKKLKEAIGKQGGDDKPDISEAPEIKTDKEAKNIGIYKLEDDTLTMCSDIFGEKLPTEFNGDARKGGGWLIVYRRPNAKPRPKAEDLAKLEGTWTGTLQDGGKKADVTLVLKGGIATLMRGKDRKNSVRSTYTVDDKATPKHMTFTASRSVASSAVKGEAIYRLEEDHLEIAFRRSGPRPKDFEASKVVALLTLDRAEDPAPKPAAAKRKGQMPPRRPTAPFRPGRPAR